MNSFQQLHNLCTNNNVTVSTAESCTAGLLSKNITAFSGSSFFFKGGIIAYKNEIKTSVLGVSENLIKEKSAVCFEVVEQMAENVRKIFSSDFSIATSGYAGPTGGTVLNPVGTVFIAVSHEKKTISKRFLFFDSREGIVNQSVIKASEYFIQELKSYK